MSLNSHTKPNPIDLPVHPTIFQYKIANEVREKTELTIDLKRKSYNNLIKTKWLI